MTTPPRAELDRLVYRAGSEVAAWRARTGRPSVQDTAPLPWAEPWAPDDDDIPF